MSQEQAISRKGVPIRLTDERWQHIIDEHVELIDLRMQVMEAIGNAERVLLGIAGEFLAVRSLEPGKAILAVYRELDIDDGFVITAFVTRRLRSLDRRQQIWPPQT
jgi:hypothetical protein